jgi:hypothetical protein
LWRNAAAEFLSNETEHWQQIAGDALLVCASCQNRFIETAPDAQLPNKSNSGDSCFPLLQRPLGFSKILLGWLRTGLQSHEESNQSHAVLKVGPKTRESGKDVSDPAVQLFFGHGP